MTCFYDWSLLHTLLAGLASAEHGVAPGRHHHHHLIGKHPHQPVLH